MRLTIRLRGAVREPIKWHNQYIIEHFDELESGDVVDVEFIVGETTEQKKSERIS